VGEDDSDAQSAYVHSVSDPEYDTVSTPAHISRRAGIPHLTSTEYTAQRVGGYTSRAPATGISEAKASALSPNNATRHCDRS
jgi:hypothetical protein